MNINSLLNSSVQTTSPLLKNVSKNSTLALGQANNSTPPSTTVVLSKQGQSLARLDTQNLSLNSMGESLSQVLKGVKEQLDYASEAGEKGANTIQKAGEAFYKLAQQIEKEAGGKPLNEQQIEKLAKADESFHAVVDQVHGNSAGGASLQPNSDTAKLNTSNSVGANVSSEGGSDFSSSSKTKKSSFHPADTNKDGKVSTQEMLKANTQKQLDTYKEVANNFVKGIAFEQLNLAVGK